jgi:hypothetical protein
MTLQKASGVIIPIHIDSHRIPKNEKGNEPEHLHHDCMFLLSTKKHLVSLDKNEENDYQWVSLDYTFNDDGLQAAINKVKRLSKFIPNHILTSMYI